MTPVKELRLKSFIYRYTGIYLAHREEKEYLQSKEFWKKFMEIVSDKDNDMSPRNVQGLLIGMWQCERRFARPMSRFWGRRPRWFWNTLDSLVSSATAIWWDISRFFKRS